MNIKLNSFIKNISYAFSANTISLIISVVMTLIVPKVLGVSEYGYWQLYLFYSGYIVYINFGWCDGIYLKYGGEDFKSINKSVISTQFFMLAIHEILASCVIYFFVLRFVSDVNKRYILLMACISGVIFVLRITLLYVLQATNQIKSYARITIIDRVIYFLLVLLLLLIGFKKYDVLIAADLIAKSASFVLVIWYCRSIVFAKRVSTKEALRETKDIIKGGIKLITANLASLLIIGVVRFAIEQEWGTVIFGKVSLTLSLSNMFTIFISAVSIVLFPTLRSMSQVKLSSIYYVLRTVLMTPLLGLLVAYKPFEFVLSIWLPQYIDSLKYMALLLPICLYETKMNMLINTYLKALRQEKWILVTNVLSVGLSLITTLVTIFYLRNLDLAVMSILILLTFRCIFAELLLAKSININVKGDISLELILTGIFIYTSWLINSHIGTVIYMISYIMYLVIKKKDLRDTTKYIIGIARSGRD